MVKGWDSSFRSFLACSILTTSFSRSRAAQIVTVSPEGRVMRQRSQGWSPCVSSPIFWIWPPNRSAYAAGSKLGSRG